MIRFAGHVIEVKKLFPKVENKRFVKVSQMGPGLSMLAGGLGKAVEMLASKLHGVWAEGTRATLTAKGAPLEKLKDDERVSYLIFNKKIWSRQLAKSGNRPYRGSNSHSKHLHISINADSANDTSPWFWWMNQPTVVNQIKAKLQPQPKKKVAEGVTVAPVCTCCKVHKPKRKAR